MAPHLPGVAQRDRRRHARAEGVYQAAVGTFDDVDMVSERTRDVSLGGLCLRGPLAAAPGDGVVVLLTLKGRQIPLIATVVGATPSGDEVTLRVEYGYVSEPSRNALEEVVSKRPGS